MADSNVQAVGLVLEEASCAANCKSESDEFILIDHLHMFLFDPLQQKFSTYNIVRYIDWLFFIPQVNPLRLHYVDESHFVSSGLVRQLAVGPIGYRVFINRNKRADDVRLTVTLVTSIRFDQCTCWASSTVGGNTASNFVSSILDAVYQGFIQRDSIVVMDNARVWQSYSRIHF